MTRQETCRFLGAESNNVAVMQLAEKYAVGDLSPECEDDAFEMYRDIGENGDHQVMLAMAMCHHYGWATKNNIDVAIGYYAKSAEMGSYEALVQLWKLHDNLLVQPSLENTFRRFSEKADTGEARALLNAGYCNFWGIGTSVNVTLAKELLLKSAKGNCADAIYVLEECWKNGYEKKQGIELLRQAAEMGSAEALYQLGFAEQNECTTYGLKITKNCHESVACYLKARDNNHIVATYNLAWLYYNGNGVQRDIKEAFLLWKKAALLGFLEAQNDLCSFYMHTEFILSVGLWPVDTDYYEAAFWCRKALDQSCEIAKKTMLNILLLIKLPESTLKSLWEAPDSFSSGTKWYSIASRYEQGNEIEKDVDRAFEMYKISARLGCADGQAALARCYEIGIGVEKNIEQSMRWNMRAAMKQHVAATDKLADQIKWYCGSDIESVFRISDKVLIGGSRAYYELGQVYEKDKRYQHNCEKAVVYYAMGARLCSSQSIARLVALFEEGISVSNLSAAFVMYKSALSTGNDRAMYLMIRNSDFGLSIGVDFTDIVERLQHEVKNDNIEAVYCLARCYRFGIVVESNYAQAVANYIVAADKGHAAARFELGECYANGIGVNKDFSSALLWYAKAAEEKYIPALRKIASCYENGVGVEKSREKAFECRKATAEEGDADLQLLMAKCYRNGIIVSRNFAEALFWCERAAGNGKPECYKYVAECYEKGIGARKNENMAYSFYKLLTEAFPTAKNMIKLGEMLENGVGALKNVEAAIECYERAGANAKLGDIYYRGVGVQRNLATAFEYYEKAEHLSGEQYISLMRILSVCSELCETELTRINVMKRAVIELRKDIAELSESLS